jgi:hypothetical protein
MDKQNSSYFSIGGILLTLSTCKALLISLMILSVIGCSQTAEKMENTPAPPQEEYFTEETAKLESQSVKNLPEAIIKNLISVSVMTDNGTEITINKEKFVETFLPFYETWEMVDKASANNYEYSIILRSSIDHPVVLQVGSKEMKWDQTSYVGDDMGEFTRFIREAAAKNFLKQLEAYQLMVTAKDLGQTKSLGAEESDQILKIIQSASYTHGKPRLNYPLYPYYVIELDVGGKNIVKVDVISPTLLAVQSGEDRLYYQTEDSLFSPLKEAVSLVDYSAANMKYLFKATDMLVVDHSRLYQDKRLILNRDKINSFEAKSIIHNFVRSLIESQDKGKNSDNSTDEPIYTLKFEVADQEERVYIFKNHFVYHQQTFVKPGIAAEIESNLDEQNFFHKE